MSKKNWRHIFVQTVINCKMLEEATAYASVTHYFCAAVTWWQRLLRNILSLRYHTWVHYYVSHHERRRIKWKCQLSTSEFSTCSASFFLVSLKSRMCRFDIDTVAGTAKGVKFHFTLRQIHWELECSSSTAPYFWWPRLPAGWCWGGRTGPWWTPHARSPVSDAPHSLPSVF